MLLSEYIKITSKTISTEILRYINECKDMLDANIEIFENLSEQKGINFRTFYKIMKEQRDEIEKFLNSNGEDLLADFSFVGARELSDKLLKLRVGGLELKGRYVSFHFGRYTYTSLVGYPRRITLAMDALKDLLDGVRDRLHDVQLQQVLGAESHSS